MTQKDKVNERLSKKLGLTSSKKRIDTLDKLNDYFDTAGNLIQGNDIGNKSVLLEIPVPVLSYIKNEVISNYDMSLRKAVLTLLLFGIDCAEEGAYGAAFCNLMNTAKKKNTKGRKLETIRNTWTTPVGVEPKLGKDKCLLPGECVSYWEYKNGDIEFVKIPESWTKPDPMNAETWDRHPDTGRPMNPETGECAQALLWGYPVYNMEQELYTGQISLKQLKQAWEEGTVFVSAKEWRKFLDYAEAE